MSSNPTGPAGAPKRGAKPSPRSVLMAAMPYMQAPPSVPAQHITIPHKLSSWGNLVHGDCVTAEEAFAKACHNKEIFISDDEVIQWAKKHGVLDGAYLPQVLDFMQADGFRQSKHIYDDGHYLAVDWTKEAILRGAISEGPVKIGVAGDQLEAPWHSTNGKSGWFAHGFHADSNEDHCVALCGYGTISFLAHKLDTKVPHGIDGNKPGYALFTWGTIGVIDEPSMLAITHEAWLRKPTTVVK